MRSSNYNGAIVYFYLLMMMYIDIQIEPLCNFVYTCVRTHTFVYSSSNHLCYYSHIDRFSCVAGIRFDTWTSAHNSTIGLVTAGAINTAGGEFYVQVRPPHAYYSFRCSCVDIGTSIRRPTSIELEFAFPAVICLRCRLRFRC